MKHTDRPRWTLEVIDNTDVLVDGERIGTANQVVTVNGWPWYANCGDIVTTAGGYCVSPEHENVTTQKASK